MGVCQHFSFMQIKSQHSAKKQRNWLFILLIDACYLSHICCEMCRIYAVFRLSRPLIFLLISLTHCQHCGYI